MNQRPLNLAFMGADGLDTDEITRIWSMEVRIVTRCPSDIVKMKQSYDALKPISKENE